MRTAQSRFTVVYISDNSLSSALYKPDGGLMIWGRFFALAGIFRLEETHFTASCLCGARDFESVTHAKAPSVAEIRTNAL